MAAEPTSPTDDYIVARLAIWAGDFDYAEKLLSRFAPLREFGTFPDTVQSTEDLIRYAAALRRRQLAKKKGEFAEVSEEAASLGSPISHQPEILETRHLRGAIWRTGIRQFQMRAYLCNLSWEKELFRFGRKLMQAHGDQPRIPEPRDPKQKGRRTFDRTTANWAMSGNPFTEITVSDFGLVEANAVWVEPNVRMDMEQIRRAFSTVLRDLGGDVVANHGAADV